MKKTIKLLVLLFTAGLATGCGAGNGGGGGGGDTSGGGSGSDSFWFDQEELNAEQSIHTQKQKNYLNYSGDYYNITESQLSSFGIDGRTNNSLPEQVTLNWEYSAPKGKEVSRFDVTFSQNQDLSKGYTVQGTANNTISFYNSFLGTNYFKVTANFTDGGKEESDIKTFKVEDVAPRNLYVGNMPNCRDMGGRATVAGGRIKQGLIYRTSGSAFDNRTPSDEEAKDILLNKFGVKTEINVSNSTNNNVSLTGTNVENAFMAYGAVPYSNLARNSVRIRQIMNVLADENNYPVFYHCRIGTDRTGITAVMINGLLGVDFQEILQDYLLSNFAPIDGLRYPHKSSDPNGDDIAKYIDAIKELPGANFQEQVYLALRLIGVPAAQLDAIINIMTEGTKANIPASFKVGSDSDLVATVSKTTTTDFKSPATYYAVPANGTVSYTFNASSAGNKDVIVYLGTTQSINQNTTTKLSASLSLKIDGAEQTIASTKNLWQAGFGSTQQDNRIGYMFNVLGSYAFSGGQHTVEIGVKSGTFNIASIGVADRA